MIEEKTKSVDEYLASTVEFGYKTSDTLGAITVIRYLDAKPCKYFVVKDVENWMFNVSCNVKDAYIIANFLKTKEDASE